VNSHEDFWLQLLCEGPLGVPETEDPLFLNALNRLRLSNAKPELLKSMEEYMFDEKHVYEAIMAETYLKGEAKGRADGIEQGIEQGVQQEREKNETENAARDKKIAEYLRSIGVSAEGVATALSIK
jgi:predicted transposase YdaD